MLVSFNDLWHANVSVLEVAFPPDVDSISGEPFNQSAADYALMTMLATETGGDKERMRDLFGRSALGQRHKWTSRPHSYQDKTIGKVLGAWLPRHDPKLIFPDTVPGLAAPVIDPFAQAADSIADNDIREIFNQGYAIVEKFRTTLPPKQKWVIEECLPVGVVSSIIATGGTGKGHFEILLAMRVALGAPLGPFNVPQPREVMIITLEDHEDEMHRRYRAAADALARSGQQPPVGNIQIIPLAGKGPFSLDLILSCIEENVSWMEHPGVALIDPLINIVPEGMDINRQSDAAYISSKLEAVAVRTQCAITYAHHTNKAAVRDGTQLLAGAASGSQEFADLARVVMQLARLTDREIEEYGLLYNEFGYVEFRLTKVNYHAQQRVPFVMRVVAGGALEPIYVKAKQQTAEERMIDLLPFEPGAFDSETWDGRAKDENIQNYRALRRRLDLAGRVVVNRVGQSGKKAYSQKGSG